MEKERKRERVENGKETRRGRQARGRDVAARDERERERDRRAGWRAGPRAPRGVPTNGRAGECRGNVSHQMGGQARAEETAVSTGGAPTEWGERERERERKRHAWGFQRDQ